MELLCPNCQKKLSLDDAYAGKMMKCPLCEATFQAPALPVFSGVAENEPVVPAMDDDALDGFGNASTTAPEQQPQTPTQGTSAPTGPSAASPSTSLTDGYSHHLRLRIRPDAAQWIPAGTMILIFLLTFVTTWVCEGPGRVCIISQNAWQAAFGGYTVDPDLKENSNLKKVTKTETTDTIDLFPPRISLWLLLYLLLLIPAVALAIAIPLLPILNIKLPPAVTSLLPWRWYILGGLLLLMFLLLTVQMVAGFGLESVAREKIYRTYDDAVRGTDAVGRKAPEFELATKLAMLQRGSGLRFAFFMHFLGLLACGYILWLDRRSTKPVPRIDLLW